VPGEAIGESKRTVLLVEREDDAISQALCEKQMLQSYALPILVPNGRPADRAATCTRHRDSFAYCRPTRIRPQNRLVNASQQTPAESYSLPGASAPDIAQSHHPDFTQELPRKLPPTRA